jgi:hypothetical protein
MVTLGAAVKRLIEAGVAYARVRATVIYPGPEIGERLKTLEEGVYGRKCLVGPDIIKIIVTFPSESMPDFKLHYSQQLKLGS